MIALLYLLSSSKQGVCLEWKNVVLKYMCAIRDTMGYSVVLVMTLMARQNLGAA